MHNHIRARREPGDDWYGEGEWRGMGEDGFRAWTQTLDEGPLLEQCECGWVPHLQAHYRVARPEEQR